MRALLVVTSLAACSVALACGGTVDNAVTSTQGTGGASGTGNGSGGTASVDGSVDSGGAHPVSEAGLTDARYVDPTCPPQPKQEGTRECDPYAPDSTCGPGEACAPFVTYTAKCQAEIIGTQCQLAGFGVQGDDCASSDCAAGFVCVSAGSGFGCARLCTVTGATDDCPSGLICSPLDVPGFFVCG